MAVVSIPDVLIGERSGDANIIEANEIRIKVEIEEKGKIR